MTLETRRGFKPDHKSFGEFILSDQARDPAVKAAHEVALLAKAHSPRSKENRAHMADQFEINERPAPLVVGGNPRAIAEVFNEHRAARMNEFGDDFGNRKTKKHRMLGRAGAAIGEFRGDLGE